jgi:hypothetical protein
MNNLVTPSLSGKARRKGLERPRHMWERNIKLNHRQVDLAEDEDHWRAVAELVVNIWVS